MATKTAKKEPSKNGKPRPKRPKQPPLDPEWGPPSFPDVDDAAEAYDGVKRERVLLSQDEATKKDTLSRVMKEHSLTTYKTPHGIICEVDVIEKVSTHRDKAETNEAD